MKALYPDFKDDVVLVAVGFGSSQDIEYLAAYQDQREILWTFAEGPDSMARTFDVRVQSTKLGIGADGVISFKEGYGTRSPNKWAERLTSLIDQ